MIFLLTLNRVFLLVFVQFPLTNECVLTINNFLKIIDL